MKKISFAVLGVLIIRFLVWQFWPRSNEAFELKTENGTVTVTANRLPDIQTQEFDTSTDPVLKAFSMSRPQFAKNYNEWRSNVTTEYAEDLGLTPSNFVDLVANAEAPKERVLVAKLTANTDLGEYCYLISKFVGSDEMLGISATVLKKENGQWKAHGRDDPKFLRIAPFQDLQALERWINENGIYFEFE